MSSRNSALALTLALAFIALSARSPAAQAPVTPQPPRSPLGQLQHDIDTILAAPALAGGFWGVAVKSLATDETLYSFNAGKLMMPASAMKIVTAAAAARKLGWDYAYETRVLAAGPIENGVLTGDLIVVGSGDPSLEDWDGSATRLFETWADRLKSLGIRAIDGRIVGDDNAFDDDSLGFGWSWDDLPAAFAAGVSGLQFNENSVQVRLAPGSSVGAPALLSLAPRSGGLTIGNFVITGAAGSPAAVQRRRSPSSNLLEMRGSMPLGSRTAVLTVSVDNPTAFFVSVLRDVLISKGIDVRGATVDIDDLGVPPSREGASTVLTYRSPPLSALAATMMKFSQNQFAETFLKTLGVTDGPGTAELGRAAARSVFEEWGLPVDGSLIQLDGSGLSRYNYVTPDFLVAVLSRAYRDERLREPFEAAFPVASRDRALEGRMNGTAAEGNARIKTGSMANVRSMGGYVRTAGGENLAFAVLANNFGPPAATVVRAEDAIVVKLAEFKR